MSRGYWPTYYEDDLDYGNDDDAECPEYDDTPPERTAERVQRVVDHYGCDRETAHRFLDLRDEGHGMHQALLMAGLADPT